MSLAAAARIGPLRGDDCPQSGQGRESFVQSDERECPALAQAVLTR